MAEGKQPSKKQETARAAQSEADLTGRGKKKASDLQSEADTMDLKKH
jgi:hypothetical protein